jgi:hypothetical protein
MRKGYRKEKEQNDEDGAGRGKHFYPPVSSLDSTLD